jgi:6-pyruvoyltetrahydropterin/6-carboxytetrahydropterin synthase
MDIFCAYPIEAARRLPNLPQDHPCTRLHGHSFRVEVRVSGEVDEEAGWVMDFADVDRAFQPLLNQLDHRCLNDIEGLENPTSENLARWLWPRLKPDLPGLVEIRIWETHRSGCAYRGEG